MLCLFLTVLIINIGYTSENSESRTNKVTPSANHLSYFDMHKNNMRLRRGVSSDVSCTQSPVQGNMTLKGGIEAGYFRKLAEHVAMQLCIELCCEEKGCDVAFMSGKNCYGVQCFNEELCRASPAKKRVTEPVMISHVTFKGERVVTKEQAPDKLQCSATRMKVGVTVRGGLKAGNFTDVGPVENMPMCVKLCCVSERCDVALLINNNCFMVSCYSVKLCEMIKSLTMDYKPSLAYVMRKREISKHNATTLQVLDTTDNQLVCKNSQIFYNTTLKGGYKAGNYTNFGKVANMSACVRLCCGNKDCDAALMLENNCFAVACRDSDNCLPVHAKSSTSLAALNPRISYITSRSEEVVIRDQLTSDGMCHAGIISYDVSLRGGSNAGNFTPHGKVGNMETCIYKCCQLDGCGVAMMLKDTCFTVVCKSDELCEKKQTATSSNFNPKIAYVFRDKSKIPTNKDLKERLEAVKHTKIKTNKNKLLADQLQTITNIPSSSLITENIPSSSSIQKNIITTISPLNKATASRKISKHLTTTRHIFSKPTRKIILVSSTNKLVNNILKTAEHGYNTTVKMEDKTSRKDLILKTFLENNTISEDRNNISIAEYFSEQKINKVDNKTKFITEKRNTTHLCKTSNCTNKGLDLVTIIVPTYRSHEIRVLNNSMNPTEKTNLSNRTAYPYLKTGISSVDGDPSCTSSEVLYNVTLRGGLHSGKFKDRGEMEDIKQCVKLCCLLDRCDLAFMLKETCFSVECLNETLCDAVPARSSIFSPTICYVYVKSAVHVT